MSFFVKNWVQSLDTIVWQTGKLPVWASLLVASHRGCLASEMMVQTKCSDSLPTAVSVQYHYGCFARYYRLRLLMTSFPSTHHWKVLKWGLYPRQLTLRVWKTLLLASQLSSIQLSLYPRANYELHANYLVKSFFKLQSLNGCPCSRAGSSSLFLSCPGIQALRFLASLPCF